MLIVVKQSFEVKNESGEKFTARNGDLVVIPDWVAHNSYFKSLCDSGKITVHLDSKTAETEIAKERASEQNDSKRKK